MDITLVIKLYNKHNGNMSKMVKELGCSRQRVHQVLKLLGLKGTGSRTPKVKVKKEHGNTKYSNVS